MNKEDLRNSILQFAIQGKLVEQREEEGTAEELYEQIQEEKQRLIETGVMRNRKKLPEITEEEIPFEIPATWMWIRLGDLINVSSGKGLSKTRMKEGDIPVYGGNGITGYHNVGNIDKETVVIGRVGFYCGSVHVTPSCAWVTDNAFITTYPENSIDRGYLVHVLRHLNLGKSGSATAQPVVSGRRIYPILIPLPPLNEQKRIAARIEELMPYVEQYGEAYEKVTKLNNQFPTEMEKSLLQYAIQGKLVDQREEEGTAEELYEQIQKEKRRLSKEGEIRKQHKLPDITKEEIPFEIPSTWMWVRLGDVISLLSGQDMSAKMYNESGKGIPYITGASNIEDSQVIINRWIEQPRAVAKKGDLLLTCKGTIGKTAQLKVDEVHIARQLMSLKPIKNDVKYIDLFIRSYVNELKSQARSMIPGINRQTVLTAIFPLPPLREQVRIVKRVEQLLSYTKELAKRE
jgi:type I restriction enzyme S subunit